MTCPHRKLMLLKKHSANNLRAGCAISHQLKTQIQRGDLNLFKATIPEILAFSDS